MPAPMVEAREVRKKIGANDVLNGVTITVERGDVVGLIGPSGCGKSTFLRCINHLTKITSGFLNVDGEFVGYRKRGHLLDELPDWEIAAKRAEIGMVFQRFNLFGHMTVLENVIEAPINVMKRPKAECVHHAESLLERVGLIDKVDSYPSQLSGGQQQRVAIARALAMRPKLMMFDEPTSALDPELAGEVLEVMRGVVNDGMTILIVTHEMPFAREVCSKVAFMDEGRIVECSAPSELFDRPVSARAKTFFQHMLHRSGM